LWLLHRLHLTVAHFFACGLEPANFILAKLNEGLLCIFKELVIFHKAPQSSCLHMLRPHCWDLVQSLLNYFDLFIRNLSVESDVSKGIRVLHSHIDAELANADILSPQLRSAALELADIRLSHTDPLWNDFLRNERVMLPIIELFEKLASLLQCLPLRYPDLL